MKVTLPCSAQVIAIVFAATQLNACISIPEPWVKPYQRQQLADPIMQLHRSDLVAQFRIHVNETREAARGGQAVTGGGCGCN